MLWWSGSSRKHCALKATKKERLTKAGISFARIQTTYSFPKSFVQVISKSTRWLWSSRAFNEADFIHAIKRRNRWLFCWLIVVFLNYVALFFGAYNLFQPVPMVHFLEWEARRYLLLLLLYSSHVFLHILEWSDCQTRRTIFRLTHVTLWDR